jgi:hypothetical protein
MLSTGKGETVPPNNELGETYLMLSTGEGETFPPNNELDETYPIQQIQPQQIQPQQIQYNNNMEDSYNVIFYNPAYTLDLMYMFHERAKSYPIGTSLYKANPRIFDINKNIDENGKYLYKKGFINNIKYTIKQSEFNIIRTKNKYLFNLFTTNIVFATLIEKGTYVRKINIITRLRLRFLNKNNLQIGRKYNRNHRIYTVTELKKNTKGQIIEECGIYIKQKVIKSKKRPKSAF